MIQTKENPGCANTPGLGHMNQLQINRHHHSEQIILKKVLTMRTQNKFKRNLNKMLSEIMGAI